MTAGDTRILVEAAVETVDAALAAERAGVDRLELCADLDVGGLTPSLSLIQQVCSATSLPVMVMIRPRPGDFVYADDEVQIMEKDIRTVRSLRVAGIVTGIVRDGGAFHMSFLQRLVRAADRLGVTFHRAFDTLESPMASLESLIALKVARVLTSGGATLAADGADHIAELVRFARGRLTIVAAGGVRAHNVGEVIERSSVREVHARFESVDQMLSLVAAAKRVELS